MAPAEELRHNFKRTKASKQSDVDKPYAGGMIAFPDASVFFVSMAFTALCSASGALDTF